MAMDFADLQGVDIHGFISQGYLKSDANNFFAQTEKGTTQFSEAGINFSSDVTGKLRMGIQFLARDLGSIGNNEVLLDWAVADYRWRDYMGWRIGNLKFRHGLYNEIRDIDMLRTYIFLPQSVYNEAWRESSGSLQGAGVYGDVAMGAFGSLEYGFQYGTIAIDTDKGVARLMEDQWALSRIGIDIDVTSADADYTYTGSLHWQTPLDGLLIGGSMYGMRNRLQASTIYRARYFTEVLPAHGGANPLAPLAVDQMTFPTEFEGEAKTYTASLEYTWRNLVLAAEYAKTDYTIAFRNRYVFTQDPIASAGLAAQVAKGYFQLVGDRLVVPEFSSVGYYCSATYRFTYWFEMGMYYAEYYPDADDRDGEKRVQRGVDAEPWRGYLKDTCMTFRFDVSDNWVLKLEGHVMRGAASILGADNEMPVNPTLDSRYKLNWLLGAAKLTFSF